MQLENLEEVYQILTETKTIDENNQITKCNVYPMRTITLPLSFFKITPIRSTLASLPNKELTNILNDFLQPIIQNIPDQFILANTLRIVPL